MSHRNVALLILLAPFALALGLPTLEGSQRQKPQAARAFDPYAPRVTTRWDDARLYVESDGMPDHDLMVGIRAWQQQVPLPQSYRGDNAWQFPLSPRAAAQPASAKTGFFRGAIAIAVNGVPIFNPIKNDGKTDTFLAGELDAFGGHSGRADDYHYHVAPVFLNGGDPSKPVAYALDGYPIYGYVEPDGKPARALDELNGHEDPALGYHYHATRDYPYLNGGFHGQVEEKEGQVDPQPHAHPVRPSTGPLPGARITAFHREDDGKSYTLTYELKGRTGTVRYTVQDDGACHFVFTAPDGTKREETYRPDDAREPGGAGEDRPRGGGRDGARPDRGGGAGPKGPATSDAARRPWLVEHQAELDADHDGVLTLDEVRTQARATFAAYDRDGDGKLAASERRGGNVRTPMAGFVQLHEAEIDADHDGVLTSSELLATAGSMFEKSDRDHDGALRADELSAPAPGQDPERPRRRRAGADEDPPERRGGEKRGGRAWTFDTDVPAHALDVILGCPTDKSIVVSVASDAARDVCVAYGEAGGPLAQRSDVAALKAGEPREFRLDGLKPDTRYTYRIEHRTDAKAPFVPEPECAFSTQRARGAAFRFAIQADSHLDEGTETSVYARTLAAMAGDRPDFVVDLGDTFMVDKRGTEFRDAAAQYLAQRYWFGLVARSAPLFLVLGNHDGETRWREPGSVDDVPHWSNAMRTRWFPSPAPDAFYSGNAKPDRLNGSLRDYYSFTWGDARFVVLDPFLASDVRGGQDADPWSWTLGAEQYAWLVKILETSTSPYTFVFLHHLVGGLDGNARGGIEAARLHEWGGHERDGRDTFATRRPGWQAPVHDLLVRHGVTAVFHGHDHFYAHQELDGIAYQLVPQPSHPGGDAAHLAQEYGYAAGEILPSPGYLRVDVAAERATVAYVRATGDGGPERGARGGDTARGSRDGATGRESRDGDTAPGSSDGDTAPGSSDGGTEPRVVTSYVLRPRGAAPATGTKPQDAPPKGGGAESGGERERRGRRGAEPGGDERPARRERRDRAEGPDAAFSLVLGRPTATSASVSVLSRQDVEVVIDHGAGDSRDRATKPVRCPSGVPTAIEIAGLKADTAYGYRVRRRVAGATAFEDGPSGTFRTQRAPGSSFTFCVQGDSHPERDGRMFDAVLYQRALENVAGDRPDFHVLLGDDFSIERLIERDSLSQSAVDDVYAHQRGFLGVVGRVAPLFLVNGNHEEAAGYLLDGTPDNPAVYAGRARTRFFALPTPDGFYTGDAEPVEHVGLLADYYAWTWGDALFVVLDPYWHSRVQVDADAGGRSGERRGKAGGRRDMWGITLGDAQYRWLATTLAESRARYKFVFAHHVMGTGRGAVEVAGDYEWGGRDPRGAMTFADERPGWELPIHGLFVKHGVTIFFQGHDHLFARQEKDGVIYQETPNPADPTYTAFNRDAYTSGEIWPNSGHLRVNVSPGKVRVDYVRAFLPADEGKDRTDGGVAYSYEISPRGR